MDLDESFADISVNESEIEITNFATDSMNLDARSAIDMTAFVSSDKDLLRAAFGLTLGFFLHRFQWHQSKNGTEESTAPGQGQSVQSRRTSAINHGGTFSYCQCERPPIARPRGGPQWFNILIVNAKSHSSTVVHG